MLLLDSGNFSDNPTPQGDARTAALLEGMQHLGYQVINVGERDLRQGYDAFARRLEGKPFKIVSANVVDRRTGKPVFAPHALVEAAAPDGKSAVRVGAIGAVRFNPVFLKAGPDGSNMVIVDPVPKVRAEVEALRAKGADVIVLLAALHIDDARRIAGEVPGLDAILGSYGGQVTEAEERVGETLILYCGNKGQRVGEVRVRLAAAGQSPRVTGQSPMLHLLTREYPNDQEIVDFLAALKPPPMPGEGGAEEPPPAAPGAPPAAGGNATVGPPREGG